MIQTQNSLVRITDVFRKYGCVILTMIVVMIAMNQHICVVKGIVLPVGNVVQVTPIIVAFRNGSFVMAKMIVEMVLMSLLRIVPNVILKWILNALITDVYPNNGFVTLLMIVEMVVMKLKQCVRTVIENVQSLSSDVTMANVLPPDGGVTLKMIAAIIVMRMVVKNSYAKTIHSNVQVVIV